VLHNFNFNVKARMEAAFCGWDKFKKEYETEFGDKTFPDSVVYLEFNNRYVKASESILTEP
jgi:hypothetical protein